MAQNALIRQRVAELQAQAKTDREWWDKKKASIQSEFMKELDEDSAKSTRQIAATGEKVVSDEDAVLVEGGGPASTGSLAGTKGGTKKRKGKK